MSAKPRPRVLCADDHRSTLAQWRRLLDDEFEVITVDGGRALVDAAMRLRPDVLVTDIAMPDLDGIAAAKLILESNPEARIVFATTLGDRRLPGKCLGIGGFGYLLKSAVAEELVPAVHAALRGDRFVGLPLR